MPSLIDLMLEGREVEQHAPVAARRGRCRRSGSSRSANWRRDTGACSVFGAKHRPCTWRSWTNRPRRSPSSASTAPIANIPRSACATRRRFDWSAPSTICSDCRRKACPIPGAGSITISGAFAFRWASASTRRRRLRPIVSCRRKATACTRSRSVRCMRESSSPAISALPPAARPWSGWSSGWDIPTRASRD